MVGLLSLVLAVLVSSAVDFVDKFIGVVAASGLSSPRVTWYFVAPIVSFDARWLETGKIGDTASDTWFITLDREFASSVESGSKGSSDCWPLDFVLVKVDGGDDNSTGIVAGDVDDANTVDVTVNLGADFSVT